MFYKFNQMTQSIVSTAQNTSMGKFLAQKAKPVEPAVIQNDYATARVPKAASAVKEEVGPNKYRVPNHPRYKKLMGLQTRFTAHDGLLVWQKMPIDMPLYYATIGLVVVGFGLTVYSIAKLATPPKNE